jgi:hypothetical protein
MGTLPNEVIESAGSFNVLAVIDDIQAMATKVANGEMTGTSAACAPKSIACAHSRGPECRMVDDVTCCGIQLLGRWCVGQRGEGASGLPAKLEAWLDGWAYHFRASFDGDERAGYSQLLEILETVRHRLARAGRLR